MQTYSMVSKRKNEGITMNVRYSNTPNNEAEAINGYAELNDKVLFNIVWVN